MTIKDATKLEDMILSENENIVSLSKLIMDTFVKSIFFRRGGSAKWSSHSIYMLGN